MSGASVWAADLHAVCHGSEIPIDPRTVIDLDMDLDPIFISLTLIYIGMEFRLISLPGKRIGLGISEILPIWTKLDSNFLSHSALNFHLILQLVHAFQASVKQKNCRFQRSSPAFTAKTPKQHA